MYTEQIFKSPTAKYPKFFALSIFREFGLDLGFDSHSRQNSISFNSRELFGQINGELQGENNEDQCTKEWGGDCCWRPYRWTNGKTGARISDPRLYKIWSLYSSRYREFRAHILPFSRNIESAKNFGENHRLRLARWFSPKFFAFSIFRGFRFVCLFVCLLWNPGMRINHQFQYHPIPFEAWSICFRLGAAGWITHKPLHFWNSHRILPLKLVVALVFCTLYCTLFLCSVFCVCVCVFFYIF